jgi:hypothetical protein
MPFYSRPNGSAGQAEKEPINSPVDLEKASEDRGNWVKGVITDRRLTVGEARVGAYIGHSLVLETGLCERSYDEIAAELGLALKTAKRAVARLVRVGWLAVEPIGGRLNFQLRYPSPALADSDAGVRP